VTLRDATPTVTRVVRHTTGMKLAHGRLDTRNPHSSPHRQTVFWLVLSGLVITVCVLRHDSDPSLADNSSESLRLAFNPYSGWLPMPAKIIGRKMSARTTLRARKYAAIQTLVVNRWSEDVQWILQLNSDIHVKLYNKGSLLDSLLEQALLDRGNVELGIHPNMGMECYGYLKYILDNYDDLPLYSTFVHAEILPGGWRPSQQSQRLYGVEMLNAAYERLVKAAGHRPLTYKDDAVLGIPQYESLNDFTMLRCVDMITDVCCVIEPFIQFDWVFSTFYETPAGSSIPRCISMDFSASFQVSRRIIRSHPRDKYWRLWQKLVEKSQESLDSGRQMCIGLEHTWHMIFREPPIRNNVNFTQFRSYSKDERDQLNSLLSAWSAQKCSLPESDDTLVVARDCHPNAYQDASVQL